MQPMESSEGDVRNYRHCWKKSVGMFAWRWEVARDRVSLEECYLTFYRICHLLCDFCSASCFCLYFKYSPTCGPSSRRIAGNDSRKSKTAEVQSISMEVILPQEFSVYFRNPVYCFRTLNCYIRCRIAGRLWSERSDSAWYEQLQPVLLWQFDDVVDACR